MTTPDLYGAWLTAGNNLHTFVADWWPAGLGLALTVGGTWLALRVARFLGRHDRVPPAPDNQAGSNADDLWTCRRIANATNTRKENEKP